MIPLSKNESREMLDAVGVVKSWDDDGISGSLSKDLTAYFVGHRAQMENDMFFVPNMISMGPGIEVMDPDGCYQGSGYSLSIHGSGYFFPLKVEDLCEFLNFPKIRELQHKVEECLGGHFRRPLVKGRRILRNTSIQCDGKWAWFGSQSF